MRFSKVLLSTLALIGFGYSLSGRVIAQLPTPLQDNADQVAPMQSAPNRPAVLVGEGALTNDEDQEKTDDGTPFDYFTFEGTAGDRVTITLESNDFDTILGLFLVTEEGFLDIAANDNSSKTTTNSSVSGPLPSSGTYVIFVSTVNQERGDYVVTLEGLTAR